MHTTMSQQYSTFHNEPLPLPYLVVNQQPPQLSHFPISFSFNTAFILGILKCAIGFVEFVLGVVNIFAVDYFTSFIAVPIWCGLTVSLYHFSTDWLPFIDYTQSSYRFL